MKTDEINETVNKYLLPMFEELFKEGQAPNSIEDQCKYLIEVFGSIVYRMNVAYETIRRKQSKVDISLDQEHGVNTCQNVLMAFEEGAMKAIDGEIKKN